jgi:twitching motility two-component system response regulator PilH
LKLVCLKKGAIVIKVLVVEDAVSELELIVTILRDHGYTAIRATNAKAAMTHIMEQNPDVVITDVVLSEGISGFEFCRLLRKNPVTKDLPIIICSSKNKEFDRMWGLKQGANVYVTKPFTPAQLIEAVKSVAF